MKEKKRIWQIALLITGATIGAGILGLPIQTGLAGTLPTLVGLVGAWLLFLITGMVLMERFVDENSDVNDYPTAYREDFGRGGEWLAILGYLINYYGIMVAYICGGAAIAQYLIPWALPGWFTVLIFFVPATVVTLFGLRIVLDANAIVMTSYQGGHNEYLWLDSLSVLCSCAFWPDNTSSRTITDSWNGSFFLIPYRSL